MAILDDVKQRLGIFYTETNKDNEISNMIAGAKAFLILSGWPSAGLVDGAETANAREAIILWCKQGQNTDPDAMRINPVMVALIAQARSEPSA